MRYRLKDRELQKKLDEATDGEFSRRLQNDRERMDGMILTGCMGMIEDGRRHHHTKIQRMTLCFATDEIEEVAEYDPHGWNAFPEVEPPEGVLMRCEWIDCDGITHHFAATCAYVVNRFEWYDDEGGEVEVSRFRPWDDSDGEEDKE